MKQHWLGDKYLQGGHEGNDISKTNVPDIRACYRHETLVDELHILSTAAKDAIASGSVTQVKHWRKGPNGVSIRAEMKYTDQVHSVLSLVDSPIRDNINCHRSEPEDERGWQSLLHARILDTHLEFLCVRARLCLYRMFRLIWYPVIFLVRYACAQYINKSRLNENDFFKYSECSVQSSKCAIMLPWRAIWWFSSIQ